MAGTDPKPFRAACLILAGGRGRRLSPEKPLFEIDGKPIVQRVAEVVGPLFAEVRIVTNRPERYAFLQLPMTADRRQGCGPLMGIYSGISEIRQESAFVCAADMPFLQEPVIRAQFAALGDWDIVVPWPAGRPEFLHAVYRRRCIPAMRKLLEADRFKIEALTERCSTLRLERDWFERHGLADRIEHAFTNINTPEDYRRWGCASRPAVRPANARTESAGPDALASLSPDLVRAIRQKLIAQETAHQCRPEQESISSIWAHSSRVGRIAHRIALAEGLDPQAALLAGLFHDMGKFARGAYHEDDVPEEETAAGYVERMLPGTTHEKRLSDVRRAILTMYLDVGNTTDIGRAVHDADCLDKLGTMGIAQFFAKAALRRRFLGEASLIRAGVELTYAHHAPQTLKTATGRALARQRESRTRRFYAELLEEWEQLGLGAFDIREEDIAGVVCILVVPAGCRCGGGLTRESDIRDALKCRSVIVRYSCDTCGARNEFSFCLPNVDGLPVKA